MRKLSIVNKTAALLIQIDDIRASQLSKLFSIVSKYGDPKVVGSVDPHQMDGLRYSLDNIPNEKIVKLKSELESANIQGLDGFTVLKNKRLSTNNP